MAIIDWTQHPPLIYTDYKSSLSRGPTQSPVDLTTLYGESSTLSIQEFDGSLVNRFTIGELDHDLIRNAQQGGYPLGKRMVVSGKVLDQAGRPQAGVLIEAWQANASGRYAHKVDQHDAPLDPNFLGVGRCVTDNYGCYRFYTIKPGAYPWKNHPNAWRPQHIHFSLVGESIADRLVTQMYFPGDPLLNYDPIFAAVPESAQDRLISTLDLGITEADYALGYKFDIVLAGAKATPIDAEQGA
ncbi:MAG: protocatechuate 3,4-dioxygenase subunit beta [Pseudomonadales bacterium]|nr:protocatechuate 3,4-dioxygenase subunit beta [Pseudomonadales bacterium]